jgi:hypothetical protein
LAQVELINMPVLTRSESAKSKFTALKKGKVTTAPKQKRHEEIVKKHGAAVLKKLAPKKATTAKKVVVVPLPKHIQDGIDLHKQEVDLYRQEVETTRANDLAKFLNAVKEEIGVAVNKREKMFEVARKTPSGTTIMVRNNLTRFRTDSTGWPKYEHFVWIPKPNHSFDNVFTCKKTIYDSGKGSYLVTVQGLLLTDAWGCWLAEPRDRELVFFTQSADEEDTARVENLKAIMLDTWYSYGEVDDKQLRLVIRGHLMQDGKGHLSAAKIVSAFYQEDSSIQVPLPKQDQHVIETFFTAPTPSVHELSDHTKQLLDADE